MKAAKMQLRAAKMQLRAADFDDYPELQELAMKYGMVLNFYHWSSIEKLS